MLKYLERRLSLSAVVAISISSMLGSGIFVLPGVVFGMAGPSLWISYLLAAFCVLPAAFSKSELATAMPTSGGTYVYIERTFGPLAGTVSGLGLWLSLLLKSTFALIGTGAYLAVLTSVDPKLTSFALLVIILFLNLLGVGKVSGVVITVITLSVLTLLGLGVLGAFQIQSTLLEPHYPHGVNGTVLAAATVFVAFAGVTKIAAIAEEVRDPHKNIPRGILLSLLIVTVIYSVIAFMMAGTVPASDYAGDLKPLYTFADAVGGEWVGVFAAIVAIATMASMANAGLLATSRFPFAMSRDHLFPSILGRLNQRFLTPVNSILVTGFFMAGALFVDIEKIAKLASAFKIIMFIIVSVTVIVLRELRVRWYKPGYKSPFYPYIQIFGILSGIYLLGAMGMIAVAAIVAISVPGVLIYFFYSQHRTDRRGVIGVRGKRKDIIDQEHMRLDDIDPSQDTVEGEAQVVVSLFGHERSPEMVVELGAALADKGKLEVAYLTEVPEQTALHDIIEETPEVDSLARRINKMSERTKKEIEFEHFYCHDLYKTVHDISQRLHCNWLVKEWGGRTKGAFTVNNPLSWLENHLACHLATFKDSGIRYINKIMVCIEPGYFDPIVVETADHLAELEGADLTFVSYLPHINYDKQKSEVEEKLAQLAKSCVVPFRVEVRAAEDPSQAIIDTSVQFDLLVLRDKKIHSARARWFGSDLDMITAKSACSVLSVLPYDSSED